MGIQERKEREKESRRRQIQKAAKELFFAKGFNATTMEDIAGRGELSVATLYNYFRSKEEMYASLNLITLKDLQVRLEKVCSNNLLSAESKLLSIKDALYDTFRHDPLSLLNILRVQLDGTLSTFSNELLNELNRLARKAINLIADVYEEGVKRGEFPEGNKNQHTDIIWGIFTGLVLWEQAKTRINPDKNFLKPTLNRAFDLILKGLVTQ